MRSATGLLVGFVALAAVALALLCFTARETSLAAVDVGVAAEEDREERIPVLLEDPTEHSVTVPTRERVLRPRPFTPVVGECSAEVTKHTANLGRVRLIRTDPQPGRYQIKDGRVVKLEESDFHASLIEEHARVFGAVVGAGRTLHMSEVRVQSATEVLLEYEDQWKKLCGTAGSREAVKAVDADALRTRRRDALGLVMGYDDADALLSSIKGSLSF